MSMTPSPRSVFSARAWCLIAVALLVWNGWTALYANPFTLTMGYDGTFYQLLARNRLHGHYEVGDATHTVGEEGRHPMWRPGLVWVEEQLARCFGSVQAGSAAASGLGTTLMELALLWLACGAFGRNVALVILVVLFTPLTLAVHFLTLAVRQGPEPWSAAAILAGLALLVEALRRRSWALAAAAGGMAGLGEWFRTGNLLLVAVPCAVYGLIYLRRRDWRGCVLTATALAGFLATVALGSMVVPSRVDKSVANLWGNLIEHQGLRYIQRFPDGSSATFCIGGLKLVPGTMETWYDYIVRASRETTARRFVADHADEIFPLYAERFGEVLASGAHGMRWITGDLILLCFLVQVVLSLVRPDAGATAVLAFAAGAMAQYFGPVVLLRGDIPTHYLLVAAPLILLVAARGAVSVASWTFASLEQWRPAVAAGLRQGRRPILVALAAVLCCLSISYYCGALTELRAADSRVPAEQAAVDALGLEGRKVACRNMSWFVDRNVQAMLLPYATVAELEAYVRVHRLDGILVWDNEPAVFFKTTPYGLLPEFDQALGTSAVFGPAQVSGAWRWYPVRHPSYAEGRP